MYCVESCIEIRRYLTRELTEAKIGRSLSESLQAMRAALRAFVDEAGPDEYHFRRNGIGYFFAALGELRSRVGMHVAVIAEKYNIEVGPDLINILPPSPDNDLSIIPGLDDIGQINGNFEFPPLRPEDI